MDTHGSTEHTLPIRGAAALGQQIRKVRKQQRQHISAKYRRVVVSAN